MFANTQVRFIRTLPGRIRIEFYGLRKNQTVQKIIVESFASREGILSIHPCVETGRVLLHYDPRKITLEQMIHEVCQLENYILSCKTDYVDTKAQVAATAEGLEIVGTSFGTRLSSTPLRTVKQDQNNNSQMTNMQMSLGNIPLPLKLSAGGLGVLGIKQFISGKSALARSPAAFNLAALVAVISGYPYFKQKFENLRQDKKWNPDLILGASALALALVRENVIVLAGLSLLEYLKWKRSQVSLPSPGENRSFRNPEIRNYSERTGRMNLAVAGLSWAITRNPLIGLAVLLAGNPRIATVPAEHAWDQAELSAKKEDLYIPQGSSLAELARLRMVIADEALLVSNLPEAAIECVAQEHEGEIWHLATSLMKKAEHPWKEEVIEKVAEFKGSLRTAFKVVKSEQGIKASVRGKEVLLGSIKFLEENGVNCDHFLIEVKRAQRQGYTVECIAKEREFLGYLKRKEEELNVQISDSLNSFREKQIQVTLFKKDNLNLDIGKLAQSEVVEIYDEAAIFEQVATRRQQGQGILYIMPDSKSPNPSSQFEIPSIPLEKVKDLQRTIEFARRIDHGVAQNFRIAKAWNVFGMILGISNALTAPLINIVGDSLTLLLLARSKGISEEALVPKSRTLKKHEAHNSQQIFPIETGRLSTEAWYATTPGEILQRFAVKADGGLTLPQVLEIREKSGKNQLEQKKPTPWISSYLAQFKEFTTLVVLGTTLLAFATGDVFDGLAMGSILLANAAIGAAQERKAEKVIEALNEFQPTPCKVIRENIQGEVDGAELVPGDIVYLEAGDRVPADLRLIRSWNLEVNEAPLTGESLPVAKTTEALKLDTPLAERKNMLYLGTDVTRGKGVGIVVGTGMETEFGYLMSLMKGQEKVITPLHEKVTSISKTFVKWAFITGGIVFIVGLLRGRPITQMISTSITLAASAVPEGLPVTITIALSAGIYRMAKKNALIRKLSALETLGRATVICTDKTGTLTKNEMTVQKVSTFNHLYSVTGNGYEPTGEIIPLISDEAAAAREVLEDLELQTIVRIGALCNDSNLEKDHEYWNVKGDPTEGALLTFAAKLGYEQEKLKHWHRVHEVPFDSNAGTMSVVCRDTQMDQSCYVFCKGSVEAVLEHCHSYQQDGNIYPLTEENKKLILEQNESFAREALRVLGFAYCPTEWVDDEPRGIGQELIYVGLVGMMDPPKPEVEKSIREAYALGVKPVMITGDHPITAIAIAKQLGIGNDSRKVLTGQELDQLSDQELAKAVEDVVIFARVTPEHKLRIVQAYQAGGQIVAMTGDGVNDTPAIKQSNVGIAMGRTGTEVTKATADMVLKKDHFGSILEGVKQGRSIIGNIRKAIGCLLTGNLAEILVTAGAVIAGLPMPLVPIQILLMNLLTDAIPAMILAVNPGKKEEENRITKRQDVVDKDLYRKVITRGILLGSISLGLFGVILGSGGSLAVAQTVAFTTLVMGQFAQTFSWRQEGEVDLKKSTHDKYLMGGIGASLLALLATLYIPSIARFFHAVPLAPQHWLYILLGAGSVSLLAKPLISIFSLSDQRNNTDNSLSMPVQRRFATV